MKTEDGKKPLKNPQHSHYHYSDYAEMNIHFTRHLHNSVQFNNFNGCYECVQATFIAWRPVFSLRPPSPLCLYSLGVVLVVFLVFSHYVNVSASESIISCLLYIFFFLYFFRCRFHREIYELRCDMSISSTGNNNCHYYDAFVLQ